VFPLRSWDIARIRQRNVYSTSDTERMLQDDRMFKEVHSKQEEGWRLDRAAIATQTNPLSAQREHNSITSLSDRIMATT